MSRNYSVFATIVAAAAAAIMLVMMCVGFSAAAPLVRSSPRDQNRVYDFTISDSKDLVSWTAFGREWIVHLELSDVVEDNTDYFHGTLEGDASAVVSFALLPGLGLSGMIATSEATYWIRAMPLVENNLSEEDADLGIFMVHDDSNLTLAPPAAFAEPLEIPEQEASDCSSSESSSESREKRTISSYKVAVYFDQKYASASNNPWSSSANTLGLFNDVNAIYKAAGLGTWTVVIQKQLTNSQSSLSTMFSYFTGAGSKSLSTITDLSYTNYIWLVGTNVGGLSYIGGVCKGRNAAQNTKMSVAGLVSYSRLWTVKTIAHEMGHTRGAIHTFSDACSGILTKNCQCSIMSYCFPTSSNNPNGAVNFFLPATISLMKADGCH